MMRTILLSSLIVFMFAPGICLAAASATKQTIKQAAEQIVTPADGSPKGQSTGQQADKQAGNVVQQTETVTPGDLFANMLMRAENGQPQAMLNVGLLYEQGLGVPRNFTQALEWYTKAALAGEKEGWMRTGACYEIGVGAMADMDKAVSHYDKAAQMGSLQAQQKLASLYLLGRGVPKDEAKGF